MASNLLWTLGFEGVLRLFIGHLISRVAIGISTKDAALLRTFGNKVGRLADEAERDG